MVAQNRLSTIDLETGDAPMVNEDERLGAMLNGEIYNFQDLQRELIATGRQFSSHGDMEVLAHLAEELSAREISSEVDGMFAFAVWDRQWERLLGDGARLRAHHGRLDGLDALLAEHRFDRAAQGMRCGRC